MSLPGKISVRSRFFPRVLAASIASIIVLALPLSAMGDQRNGAATAIWGQPTFKAGNFVCRSPSSHSFCQPSEAVVDSQGNLWVADSGNSRVLMFPYDTAAHAPAPYATKVFGQYGRLTESGCDRIPHKGRGFPRPSPASAYSLCFPTGVAVNSQGTLFVSDAGNNRILGFLHAAQKAPTAPADLVLGQVNFTSGGANTAVAVRGDGYSCPPDKHGYTVKPIGPSRHAHFGLSIEATLQVGHPTNLVIGLRDKRTHHRLARTKVVFDASEVGIPKRRPRRSNSSGLATWKHVLPVRVGDVHVSISRPYFQSVKITIPAAGPATQCTLDGPGGLSFDSQDNLLVADSNNNRVLMWSHSTLGSFTAPCAASCAIPASAVWGQGGNFTTTQPDQWPPFASRESCPEKPSPASACTLDRPVQAVADKQGDLFIADSGDNRVLMIHGAIGSTPAPQNATLVYGQTGNFASTEPNLGGIGATSLSQPRSLSFDSAGALWVADFNNRVLEYPPVGAVSPTTAIGVLGQRGSFTSAECNLDGTSSQSLCLPESVAFDSAGALYVSDQLNNRILAYAAPSH